MNIIKQHLTLCVPPAGQPAYLNVDSATRYGWVLGPDGEPQRVDSNYTRVVVPTFDFAAARLDEDEPLAKVLSMAAGQMPMKLANPSQLDKFFWVKNNQHMKLFMFHPDLQGKFIIPVGVPTFKSSALPRNQLTCLGDARFAGYYVQQGHRRGVLAHDNKGLRGIQFSQLEP